MGRQFCLGARRSGDQDRAGVCDALCNALKELLIDRRMATVPGIRFVMEMLMRVAAVDGRVLDFDCVELEDFRFVVVDPDERVIVLTHDRVYLNLLSNSGRPRDCPTH